MTYLLDYKEAIGKTITDVREFTDRSYEDPIEYTLILFNDDSCILYMNENGYRNSYGIIDTQSSFFTEVAKKALNL